MSLHPWMSKGKRLTVYDHTLFVVDEGNHAETLLILHGFPSSSFDYWRVWPILSQHFRLVVHDHPGFGWSGKPESYSYSLIEQADIALRLWQQLGIQKAHLLAHDYGTSIATELVARNNIVPLPIDLSSVTLCNGSMLIEMARLKLVQRLLRNSFWGPKVAKLSTKRYFIYNMKSLWADQSRIDMTDLEILWEGTIRDGGRKVLPAISRYTLERKKFWHRWIGGLEKTDIPINILWATEDPVAVVEMANVLHQKVAHSQLQLLEGIGHYPMLEQPAIWADTVIDMIQSSISSTQADA